MIEAATPQPHERQLGSVLIWAYWLGKSLMMDFGFGGFLDKFEGRFGKLPTTILLVLVGLSVAAFCVNITASLVVSPVITFVQGLIINDRDARGDVFQTIGTVLNIFLFMFFFVGLWSAIDARRDRKYIAQVREEYEVFQKASHDFWTESERYVENLYELFDELEGARSAKRRRELLSDIVSSIHQRRYEYSQRVAALNQEVDELRQLRKGTEEKMQP